MNEQYNLLAEFGRVDGQTVYLARDRATGAVAIARRRSDDPSGPLTISHALDATVPADGAVCSSCMDSLRTWGRFCPNCGREVFGAQPTSPDSPSRDQLLEAVRHAAEGRFDILGSMPRAEGGDTIYFAVDLNTADVVALLLNREGIEADGTLAYSLELPLTLSPVAKGPAAAPAVAAKPAPPPPPPPKADSFTAMFGAVAPPPPAPPVVMPPPVVIPPPVVPPPPVSATLAPMSAATPAPERTRRTTAPIPEPTTPVLSPPPARQRQAVPKGVLIAGVAAVLGLGVLFVVLALRPKAAPPPVAVAQDTTTPTPAPVATADTAKPAPDTTTVAAETPPPAPVAPAPVAPAVTKPTPPTPRRKRLTGRDTLGLAEAIHDCSSSTLAGDWSTAAPVCERAAAAGDPDAELSLGMMYQRGNGVPGSLADAFKWFQKASDGGSIRATNYLAWAYANGDGVKRDGAAAIKLFHKSATSGNAQGEYGLGMMYANGTGAMRSDSLAVVWFRKAAAQNDPLARSELTRRGLTP
jgi:hypothetical protein